jgi:DNA repair protein RadC
LFDSSSSTTTRAATRRRRPRTSRLRGASGKSESLHDIALLDHVVLGAGRYCSFADENLL